MRDSGGDARRFVIKLGSNLFFNDAGAIALGRIFSFIEDIAAARRQRTPDDRRFVRRRGPRGGCAEDEILRRFPGAKAGFGCDRAEPA